MCIRDSIGSVPTVCRSKFAPLPCLIQFHCEAAEIVVDLRICRSGGSLGLRSISLIFSSHLSQLTSHKIELGGTAPKSSGGCLGKFDASGLIFSNLQPSSATREDGSALHRNSVQRP